MGIGVSIFLIAVGAILTFAVHATLSGVSILRALIQGQEYNPHNPMKLHY